MSRSSVAFPRSYQRHLVTEQRKAVLAALRDRIGPEHTVGEVLDAAEALGWAEPMGDLSLADLAAALLTPIGEASRAASDGEAEHEGDESDVDDEPDDEEEEEAPPQRARAGKKKAAKATKAPVAKGKGKVAAKKASARAPEPASKKTAKKGPAPKQNKKAQKQNKKAPSKAPVVTTARGGKGKPAISKKTGKGRHAAPVDFDEPMSLEDAAGVLVPLVRSLGEATMQDLEEQTAGGRRKLRFHIGQLVRRGYLVRHGMGRGTFYTVG